MPPRIIYIGIDPGKSGGLAVFRPWFNAQPIGAHKCPATSLDMWTLLYNCHCNHPDSEVVVVLEKVTGFSGQAAGRAFNFGVNYGQWLMALTGQQLPFVEVPPGRWQKHYGKMPKGATAKKNRLKELAQQRFPQLEITHYIAAALLLAQYAKDVAWPE